MNNVGVPLSDNSQYERPPIAAMFNVPYTYRCDMRREFVKRWCNSNVDIICYVTKVRYETIGGIKMNFSRQKSRFQCII